jgi:hypothetical protein
MKNESTYEGVIDILAKHVNQSALLQALKDYELWAKRGGDKHAPQTHGLQIIRYAEQRSGISNLKEKRDLIETIAQMQGSQKANNPESAHNKPKRHKINRHYEIEHP